MNDMIRKVPPNLHILKLTFLFFMSGMIMFIAAMIAAIWFVPDLIALQSVRHPKGWLLAHMMLLGWASMVAMGASFQITQIVMRTAIYSRTLGYFHYIFYTMGLLMLMAGFLVGEMLILAGGLFITIGVVMYIVNLAMTFIQKGEWNLFVVGVSFSLIELLLTVLLGIKLGLGFAFGWFPQQYNTTFLSHLWFGIGGWLSGLIIVYSFKLLSMFYVSKKKVSYGAYWIIGGYHLGIGLQVLSIWLENGLVATAAKLCMIASLGWFVVYMNEIRNQSHSKQPIGAVHVSFILIVLSYLLFIIWTGLTAFGLADSRIHEGFILYLVFGWFSATILSYLSKILPFLWWAKRFRTKEEKKGAILLSQMLPERRLTVELWGYLLAVGFVLFCFLRSSPGLAYLAQVSAAGFILVYLIELLRVFRH